MFEEYADTCCLYVRARIVADLHQSLYFFGVLMVL